MLYKAFDIFKANHVLTILCAHLSQSGETHAKVMSESYHGHFISSLHWKIVEKF